jgi:glycosyltransferase involved in cell wall biosynthesis
LRAKLLGVPDEVTVSMARQDKIRVHQFHSGSSVADAVTNCMFFVQSMLENFGFESDIFVEHLDPSLSGRIRRLEDLRPAESDLLLIHHSMGHDAFSRLADLRCRKFLVYHNITPPRFFEENDPFHFYGMKGYSQLAQFRDIVESAIAVSPFNARQLKQRGFQNVTVIPLLKDFAAIRYAPHAKTPYFDEAAVRRLLFVGRVVPHKCQHELVEFVDKVRSIGRVPLGLILVGHFDDANGYKSHLDALVHRSGLGRRVEITGQVTDEELFGWYRAANAYVSLSEHEGFGVPLVEAMAFDLPVIAYASAAVAETLGDAGITISEKDPERILEPLMRLHEDRSFRGEVIRSQRQRLLRFSRKRIESELRHWLIDAGACDSATSDDGLDAEIDDHPPPTGRTHYIIEGPFETSYSLAIVNRNIALALGAREACASYIEPGEGTEDYSVDSTAAGKLSPDIRELVRDAPVTAERIVTIRNTYPPRPNGMIGDMRLLHLAWEESAISDALAELMNLHLDAVLVPSEYSRRAIRNSGVRLPIAVIGHGIDHSGLMPRVIGDRARRGPVTPALPFTFLHISSGLARKGIEELITAYCLAFSRRDPVLLVIKTFDNPTNTIDTWFERLTRAKHAPAIQVISEELDQRQMDFLYHVADALLLPSRGEGFNLPAAEGMARGLPVIVTRHSGHLDFCNDENSFLIDCVYDFSSSHLKIPNSFWARASIEQLVRAMKTAYRDGRSPDTMTAYRAAQGRRDTLQLRWQGVAGKVDGFVDYLQKRPVMSRKLRLGWVSTYNARCGIATHSEHLLKYFDQSAFEITILADDQEPIGPDPENIIRLWSRGGSGLARVASYLIANGFDAAVFQYNFAFFDFRNFVDTLMELSDAGINTFVIFHRTRDLEDYHPPVSHPKITEGLQSCTRIFVHVLEDVNRLRELGVTQNVVLLTHGVIDRSPLDMDAVRSLLGLSEFNPVIGTFGFLLPGKGLTQLIHSFALILRAYPAAYLLMLNADYPTPESQEHRERCLALGRLLELEGHLKLINEFLEIEEMLFLLSACDAIVFPYQRSEESASGAVRLGLAAGRPILTTPLPIFSDLSEVVYQLPGREATEIADGILSLLDDRTRKSEILQRQRDWVRANSWASQAARLSNIIHGCFEESHGVELRVPRQIQSGLTLPAAAEIRTQGTSDLLREQDLAAAAKFFQRRAISRTDNARALRSPAEIGNPQPIAKGRFEEAKEEPSSLRGDNSWLISRGDRARDSRDWVSAARYYRQALDQKPDNPPIWVQYGHALKESGNLGEAEAAYRKSLELDADVADTYLQLGHALKIQGRKIEASVAYLRALALDPALDHASFELRGLGWTKGRIQLALRREWTGKELILP